jgi:GH15 family glucan-1,4-alpha-glucosidase
MLHEVAMPRDIPVGNRQLLICFDNEYRIRDLYFPHVGQENHIGGNICRFGLLCGERFCWVPEGWRLEMLYQPDSSVTRVDLYQPDLGLLMTCQDAVDFHENIYVRQVRLENLGSSPQSIELFFSQDLDISGNSIGDTAAYDPRSGGVVHYKGARYFLIGGESDDLNGFSQYAVGVKQSQGREGTFRDAEDGRLSGNPVAQGSVDSVVSLRLDLPGFAAKRAFFWICAGSSWSEVRRLDGLVRHKRPQELIRRTGAYWNLWVRKEPLPLDSMPQGLVGLYRRSLLVLNTQIDWRGGILAANDSDVIAYNRDTYSYIWPRDGALVANALDSAGYPTPSQRFYSLMAELLEQEGYLLHKFNPDGTLASSWHPWVNGGEEQLPIQEDETGLVLWALWQHFQLYRDIEFIKPLYRSLIKKAADFMVAYRDPGTGLPGPSYDLWEERRGISSFTVGAVFGGLAAASLFCQVFGEDERAEGYRLAASQIRDGASRYLWRENLNRFCRMLVRRNGQLWVDETPDASLWGLFAFGLYSPLDSRIASTMDQLQHRLWVDGPVGGLARYEGDGYHRANPEQSGNPWIISTLWLADYLIRTDEDGQNLGQAEQLLEWVAKHSLPSGVMPEQVHPDSGRALSVSPLTWSHATFVSVFLRLASRRAGAPPAHDVQRQDWISRLYSEACDSIYGRCLVQ